MKNFLRKLSHLFSPDEGISIQGKVRVIGRDKVTGEIVADTGWKSNLIMLGTNTGKALIIDRLSGTNAFTGNILYCDIGTGSTTPAVSDTAITTPVLRTGSPVMSISSNVLTVQFFFADANLANGTYKEIGTFVDGNSTVSTGQIFNHALFASNYVKTSGVDTTVQVDFTLT